MLLAEAAQADAASGPTTNDHSAPASATDANLVEEGRVIFNSNCSHCHGPNAVAGDPYMDLPALLREQGPDMDSFFYHTVTNGIPSVGMPTWGPVLSHEQMRKMLAFLHAAQNKRFGIGNSTGDTTTPTSTK